MPIRKMLQEIAGTENRAARATAAEETLVGGEGKAGFHDQSKPAVIQRMRASVRVLHHPIHTE
ncbi:MAG: hypothetical protein AAFU85_33525 [Planctomycetota bacterium]